MRCSTGSTAATSTDLDISNTTIQNTGDEVWESNVYLWDLKGVASAGRTNVFTGLNLTNDSGQFNIWIQNNDGTNDRPAEKDRVEISNSTFTRNGNNPLISDNISVFNSGTGNTQVVVSNSTFTATATCGAPAFAGACVSDNIQVDAGNNAAFDFDLSTGNNLTDGNAGQAAVNVSASGAGQGTFNVRNITTSVRAGQGINVVADHHQSRGLPARHDRQQHHLHQRPEQPRVGYQHGARGRRDDGRGREQQHDQRQRHQPVRLRHQGRRARRHRNGGLPDQQQLGSFGRGRRCLVLRGQRRGRRDQPDVRQLRQQPDRRVQRAAIAFTDYFVEMYTGTTFQIQGLTGSGTNAANVGNFISSTDDDPAAGDPVVDAGSGTTVNYTNAVCATP